MPNMKKALKHPIQYCDDQYQAIENADALAIMTEWNVFRTPDYKKMQETMKNPLVFDGRNVFNSHQMKDLGFKYFSIGRPNTN